MICFVIVSGIVFVLVLPPYYPPLYHLVLPYLSIFMSEVLADCFKCMNIVSYF